MHSTLASYLLVLAITTLTVQAQLLDNTAAYTALNDNAFLPDEGTYIIRNVGNDKELTYTKTDVPNLFPSNDGTPIEIKQHGDGTRWVRISYGDNKCLSSQWNARLSADHAGVSYECVVDPIDPASSLEKTKQWWILAGDSLVSALQGLDGTDEGQHHDEDEKDDDTPGDDASTDVMKQTVQQSHKRSNNRRSAHRRLAAREKRETKQTLGPFWLIPVDHLKDMQTRALCGKEKRTVGGYRSTKLERLDVDDVGQQWTLTRVAPSASEA